MGKIIKILLFFLFTNAALGDDLPNQLFDIKLMSSVSALKGNTSKGKGVVQIKGIPYIYYSVDNDFYNTDGEYQNITVQARKSDGTITSVIGESKLTQSECLVKLQKTKVKLEAVFNIKFETHSHQNDKYYLLMQNKIMLGLICEVKREVTLRLILSTL
jgi:hypothetical protein